MRVEPQLRDAAEAALRDGETRTGPIETSVGETILRRRSGDEFVARGLGSRDDPHRTEERCRDL